MSKCEANVQFSGMSSNGRRPDQHGTIHCTKEHNHEGNHAGYAVICDGILFPVEWPSLPPIPERPKDSTFGRTR